MADTTFEQAKRCPNADCQQPGKLVSKKPQGNGIDVHVFECTNERCQRHEERWIVQTNPDGSIPQNAPGPKSFPRLDHYAQRSQNARDELRILEAQSLHPNLTRREIIQMLGG